MRPSGFRIEVVRPGRVQLVRETVPVPGPGEVLLHTIASGISAGTERTYFEARNPYMEKRWDLDLRLFLPGEPTFRLPRTFGYMNVGMCIDGDPAVQTGTLVFGGWGHRSHAVLTVEDVRRQIIAPRITVLEALFLYKVGPIACNGLFSAAEEYLGEHVVIFGGGAIGLLVGELARANGARSVLIVDPNAFRRRRAEALGLDAIDPSAEPDIAYRIKRHRDPIAVAFEVSGSYRALANAVRVVRQCGLVVAMGFYQGSASDLPLGEEFHHNQIRITCAQIGQPRQKTGLPCSRADLSRTFAGMLEQGAVHVAESVSHIMPVNNAQAAFERAFYRHDETLQVVLEYPVAEQSLPWPDWRSSVARG